MNKKVVEKYKELLVEIGIPLDRPFSFESRDGNGCYKLSDTYLKFDEEKLMIISNDYCRIKVDIESFINDEARVAQFTSDGINLLKILSKDWNYIARDENGELFIFKDKPQKSFEYGTWDSPCEIQSLKLFNEIFNVQFSDEDPLNIQEAIEGR